MAMTTSTMLGLAMRFDVVIDGIKLGGWQQCQGLAVNFGLEERTEGGVNDCIQYLPGRVSYSKIKLYRAMNATDSAAVMAWLSKYVDGGGGDTGEITLRDAHNKVVASWTLRNVKPASWSGPTLSAMKSDVAIEVLELVHEGFL